MVALSFCTRQSEDPRGALAEKDGEPTATTAIRASRSPCSTSVAPRSSREDLLFTEAAEWSARDFYKTCSGPPWSGLFGRPAEVVTSVGMRFGTQGKKQKLPTPGRGALEQERG